MSEPAVCCLACGTELIAELEECFECDAPAPAAPGRTVRYRVTRPTGGADALGRSLAGLAPSKADVARWLAERPSFDVVIQGTEAQHATFARLLAGATFQTLDESAFPLSDAPRWTWHPGAKAKVGVTGAFAVAALVVGAPTVLVASAAIGAYLGWRGLALVECTLTPPREAIDAQLSVFEPGLRASYRAARRALGQAEARKALDRCAALVAQARSATRRSGEHLRDPAVRRLDAQLGRVLNELCLALGRLAQQAGATVAAIAATERALRDALEASAGAAERAALLERHLPGGALRARPGGAASEATARP